MSKDPQWQTLQVFCAAEGNVASAVKVIYVGGGYRYQIHLGRINRAGAFSPGVSVLPELDASSLVQEVYHSAQEYVRTLRGKQAGSP